MAIEMSYGDAEPGPACYQCLKTGMVLVDGLWVSVKMELVPFDNPVIPGGRRWICRECHVSYYAARCKEEDVLQ